MWYVIVSGAPVAPHLSCSTFQEDHAAGRRIEYVPITIEQHAAEAAEHGVPGEVIELLTYLFGEVLNDRNAATADGVRRALDREAGDFADFARAVAASGTWDPAPVSA